MGVTRLGYRGVIGRFYARLGEVNANAWAPRVGMHIDTDQASEEYKWLGQAPAVREWLGGRQPAALRESGIDIKNKRYEASIELDVDELRRDKSGQMLIRVDDLAVRVAEHWHRLLSDLMVTPGKAYDGQNFYSATHAEGDSGTQINLFTATEIGALDCTLAAPTVLEVRDIVIGIITKMMAFADDKGEPLNANAKSFLFMVPMRLLAVWIQAITLPVIGSGTGGVDNVLVKWPGLKLDVIANPRLSSNDIVYTFIDDQPVKPFIMQEEMMDVGEDDQTFQNNKRIVGVKLLRNVGTAFWQYASKSTLS